MKQFKQAKVVQCAREGCEKEFKQFRKDKKYCSDSCRAMSSHDKIWKRRDM